MAIEHRSRNAKRPRSARSLRATRPARPCTSTSTSAARATTSIAGSRARRRARLAVGAQLFFFSGGPGTPAPTPLRDADARRADTAARRREHRRCPAEHARRGPHLDRHAHPQRRRRSASSSTAPPPRRPSSSTISLVQSGFYDGVTCHRLTNGGFYVLQCGDPTGDGTGGPGYSYGPIENAPADDVYPAGTIAMARAGGNALQHGQPVLHRLRRHHHPVRRRRRLHRARQRSRAGSTSCKAQITDAGVADGASRRRPGGSDRPSRCSNSSVRVTFIGRSVGLQ